MDAGVHVDTVRTAVRQRLRILLAVPRTSILRDVKDLENCWSARPAARSKDQMSMVVARRVQLAAAITSCARLGTAFMPTGVAASTLMLAVASRPGGWDAMREIITVATSANGMARPCSAA